MGRRPPMQGQRLSTASIASTAAASKEDGDEDHSGRQAEKPDRRSQIQGPNSGLDSGTDGLGYDGARYSATCLFESRRAL
ncbi:hypothetical protein DXU03_13330 [Rhizobium johnstonii]